MNECHRTGVGKINLVVTLAPERRDSPVIKSGYLEKQGKMRNVWQSRWMILKSDGLFWYQYHTVMTTMSELINNYFSQIKHLVALKIFQHLKLELEIAKIFVI